MMKNVLVLGAGRIAGPCIRHLLKEPDLFVTVVDQVLENALKVVEGHPRGKAHSFDLQETDDLIKKVDLVVSLLPRSLDEYIIKKCIENKTSIVFPNFISSAIRDLEVRARKAGVTVLGEIGLDPGIDHMSAVQIIDKVKEKGGKVKKFSSWCGGLPAPEAALEPLRYKFSWSPEGVLEASGCPAKFLECGKVVYVDGKDLMKNYSFKYVPECGWFEEYPNSDATCYVDIYNIPEVNSIYRGTFRYPGWCETIACLHDMGMFDTEKKDLKNISYADYTCKLPGLSKETGLTQALASYLGVQEHSLVIKNLKWLGLFDQVPVPFNCGSARDILADLLLNKLQFGKNERDLVVMLHEFEVLYPDGRCGQITSSLIEYGRPGGDSAMARTTGLPIAAAAKQILTAEFKEHGVQLPVDKKIYKPVLNELAELGIAMKDNYYF